MIKFIIVLAIIELIFSPRIDYDNKNKQVFLWYSWEGKRKNIKLI